MQAASPLLLALARSRAGAALALIAAAAVALGLLVFGTGGRHSTPAAPRLGAHRVRSAPVLRASAMAWSAPRTLESCVLPTRPQVAFPSESPSLATGPGAIVWAASGSGCGAPPTAPASYRLAVAALSDAGQPSATRTASLPGAQPAALAAVGASFGRVAVATGPPSAAPAAAGVTVLQGRANGPLQARQAFAGEASSLALARAYLGDVTLVSVVAGPAIAVRVQRYFRRSFQIEHVIPIARGRVSALTATMDYRSDVLIAWQQSGSIYARMVRASGGEEPTQRIGASAPDPQLRALVSDDNHGMVAWSTTTSLAAGGARTHVYLDLSGAGVRFGAPALLTAYTDPLRAGVSCCSLGLVRLSTENVLLAWTDAENGHYVVRAAPAVYATSRPATLLSDPRGQAVLGDLEPGPRGEAIVLWSELAAPSPGAGGGPAQLWAARMNIVPHDRVVASPPEPITPGPAVEPSVAIDPVGDRAVVAWLTPGSEPSIRFATGFPVGP